MKNKGFARKHRNIRQAPVYSNISVPHNQLTLETLIFYSTIHVVCDICRFSNQISSKKTLEQVPLELVPRKVRSTDDLCLCCYSVEGLALGGTRLLKISPTLLPLPGGLKDTNPNLIEREKKAMLILWIS